MNFLKLIQKKKIGQTYFQMKSTKRKICISLKAFSIKFISSKVIKLEINLCILAMSLLKKISKISLVTQETLMAQI